MANMKTLTVNGVTYTIDDPDAVSYGTEQVLTEEEKQRARENIGAASTETDMNMNGKQIFDVGRLGVRYGNDGFYLRPGLTETQGEEKISVAMLNGLQNGLAILRGVHAAVDSYDAVNKAQLEDAIRAFSESDINMKGNNIKNIAPGVHDNDAVNLWQMNNAIQALTDNDIDMKGSNIRGVGQLTVGDADGTEGVVFSYENKADNPNGNPYGVAIFNEVGDDGAVILRNIAPGKYDYDAATKGQLDIAVKDIIDKTCPAFTQSGAIVTCEPVEGYPLIVVTDASATKLTQYGKNLLTSNIESKTASGVTFTANSDGSITVNGTATADVFYEVGKAQVKAGQTYTLNGGAEGGGGARYALFVAHESVYYYDYGKSVTFTGVANKNNTFRIMVKKGTTVNNSVFKPMLRLASVADAGYERYQAPLTYAPGKPVPALPGVNTIYADAGEITVTGRANPAAIIKKLTNAILSTGGNV